MCLFSSTFTLGEEAGTPCEHSRSAVLCRISGKHGLKREFVFFFFTFGGVNSETVGEFWWNMILGIAFVGLKLSGWVTFGLCRWNVTCAWLEVEVLSVFSVTACRTVELFQHPTYVVAFEKHFYSKCVLCWEHLVSTIESFIYPTDAQLDCSKDVEIYMTGAAACFSFSQPSSGSYCMCFAKVISINNQLKYVGYRISSV